MTVDAADDLWVAGSNDNRVQKFGDTPPGSPGPDGPHPTGPTTAITTTTPPASVAPRITRLTQSHSTWRAGRRLAVAARRRRTPVGTTFSFSLDQDARVRFVFTRRRHRRTVTVGTLAAAGHAGSNRLAFQGRLTHRRQLRPGRYTLVITATNAAGQHSARSLNFRIVQSRPS